MKEVYLDNSATTKVSKEIIDESITNLNENYANPSSLHKMGFEAEKIIRRAKVEIGRTLGVSYDEIYFTSGGTLSNNIAILGTYEARKRTHKRYITSKVEHASVIEIFKALEERGEEVIYLENDEFGYVSKDDLKRALNKDTALVSIIHVNNEIGTINDINEIGKIIKENSNAYFHVDGVQSYGKIPFNLKNVDMFTISSHKIHGMKGVGGLYINRNIKIKPIIFGGGQQNGIVPGTENLNGIISFHHATKLAYDSIDENYQYVKKLKDEFLSITKELEDVYINGDEKNSSPYILNISFLNIRAEVLLHALESNNIYISTGSACASNSKDSKNIISKLGKDKIMAEGAVRISFSKYNTLEEIKYSKDMIIKHVNTLRKYTRKK